MLLMQTPYLEVTEEQGSSLSEFKAKTTAITDSDSSKLYFPSTA